MMGIEIEDKNTGYFLTELFVRYSLSLNKAYDRFQFLEKLIVIIYFGQISRSLMEMNVSSLLRNNTRKLKK